MNGMDWALLGVVSILVIVGLVKGLIRVVFAVLSVVLAIVLAGRFTAVGSELLAPLLENRALAAVAGFVLVFVLVLVIMALFGRALLKAVHVLGLGWVDRLGGALLGLATALLLVGAAFLLIDLAGLDHHSLVRESTLAPYGSAIADRLGRVFPDSVHEMIRERRKNLEDVGDLLERGQEQIEEMSSQVDRVYEGLEEE